MRARPAGDRSAGRARDQLETRILQISRIFRPSPPPLPIVLRSPRLRVGHLGRRALLSVLGVLVLIDDLRAQPRDVEDDDELDDDPEDDEDIKSAMV